MIIFKLYCSFISFFIFLVFLNYFVMYFHQQDLLSCLQKFSKLTNKFILQNRKMITYKYEKSTASNIFFIIHDFFKKVYPLRVKKYPLYSIFHPIATARLEMVARRLSIFYIVVEHVTLFSLVWFFCLLTLIKKTSYEI